MGLKMREVYLHPASTSHSYDFMLVLKGEIQLNSVRLVVCCTVLSGKQLPTRNLEAVRPPVIPLPIHQQTRRNISGDLS
jgi:hypothetical protein